MHVSKLVGENVMCDAKFSSFADLVYDKNSRPAFIKFAVC